MKKPKKPEPLMTKADSDRLEWLHRRMLLPNGCLVFLGTLSLILLAMIVAGMR